MDESQRFDRNAANRTWMECYVRASQFESSIMSLGGACDVIPRITIHTSNRDNQNTQRYAAFSGQEMKERIEEFQISTSIRRAEC